MTNEISYPSRGAVKFERSFLEGLNLSKKQNQTNEQPLAKALVGWAAVLALCWTFQKETKQIHHLVGTDIVAWAIAYNLQIPKQQKKNTYKPKDLCSQCLIN